MKLAIFALPLALASGSALAADNMQSSSTPPAACSEDVQKFCATRTSDADKNACLHENMQKVSDACRTAMGSSSQQEQQGGNQPQGY